MEMVLGLKFQKYDLLSLIQINRVELKIEPFDINVIKW